MSRRRRDRNPLGQGARQHRSHHSSHGPRRAPAPFERAAENPLIQMLRGALRSEDPTEFWVATSPLVTEIASPQRSAEGLPDGVDLLDTFIEIEVAETTAVLHMIAATCPDPELRSRARVGLTARRQPMPPQIAGLAEATVSEAVAFTDGVGENLMVELVLPRGVRAVLIAYVKWLPAPYVKDAFVVDDSMDGILAKYRLIMAEEGDSLDEVLEQVSLADARARFEEALAATPADLEPSGDWEQWPMLRPFAEFVVGLLPPGGTGYEAEGLHDALAGAPPWASETPPWVDEDGTDLVDEFVASQHAADLPHDEEMQDLVAFVMMMLKASTGDPLAWEEELAEWMLTEVLPSSPMLPDRKAVQLPTVLPALIAWSLERTGEDPSVITRTLDTATPLLEGFAARRADPRMRTRRLEEHVDLALELEDPTALQMIDLALRAGGLEVLADLGTAPLPAEPLDLDQFSDDLRDLAAEIDTHMADGATALLEGRRVPTTAEELLTACRRLLVRIAQLDDAVLRRKASTRNTAAAILSLIARGNRIMGYPPATLHEKDLRAALDLRSSPLQRANSLAEAAALPHHYAGIALGDPDLLLGAERARIRAERDRLEVEE
jgi:hypothetical protein